MILHTLSERSAVISAPAFLKKALNSSAYTQKNIFTI